MSHGKLFMKRSMRLIVFIAFLTVAPIIGSGQNFIFMQPVTAQASVSFGKRNALKQAKNYLRFSAFSKKGLIKQLKFEGYSNKEASYAVKHCGANWKKQAVRKAKQYLSTMAFSKKRLNKQLRFEGFTKAEAAYGVKKAYK